MSMKITDTKKAFAQVLQERGIYKRLGVSMATVSNWRRALEGHDERNMPTLEMLNKYGAEGIREKVWCVPD